MRSHMPDANQVQTYIAMHPEQFDRKGPLHVSNHVMHRTLGVTGSVTAINAPIHAQPRALVQLDDSNATPVSYAQHDLIKMAHVAGSPRLPWRM